MSFMEYLKTGVTFSPDENMDVCSSLFCSRIKRANCIDCQYKLFQKVKAGPKDKNFGVRENFHYFSRSSRAPSCEDNAILMYNITLGNWSHASDKFLYLNFIYHYFLRWHSWGSFSPMKMSPRHLLSLFCKRAYKTKQNRTWGFLLWQNLFWYCGN